MKHPFRPKLTAKDKAQREAYTKATLRKHVANAEGLTHPAPADTTAKPKELP